MNKTSSYIPLRMPCPPQCICYGQEIRNQTHFSCQTQLFINQNGDVACQNYLNGKGCKPAFIQDVQFQCEKAKKNKSLYQFKKFPQFMGALSYSQQAAELDFNSDYANVEFTSDLLDSTKSRWKF